MYQSQKRKILGYLGYKGGEGATAMELITKCGVTNPTGRISELRKDRWDIVNMTPRELRECGIESKYNLYFVGEFAPKPNSIKAEDVA